METSVSPCRRQVPVGGRDQLLARGAWVLHTRVDKEAAAHAPGQGLTLVHLSAESKRFLWNKGLCV